MLHRGNTSRPTKTSAPAGRRHSPLSGDRRKRVPHPEPVAPKAAASRAAGMPHSCASLPPLAGAWRLEGHKDNPHASNIPTSHSAKRRGPTIPALANVPLLLDLRAHVFPRSGQTNTCSRPESQALPLDVADQLRLRVETFCLERAAGFYSAAPALQEARSQICDKPTRHEQPAAHRKRACCRAD
jgi:hypothetical protein